MDHTNSQCTLWQSRRLQWEVKAGGETDAILIFLLPLQTLSRTRRKSQSQQRGCGDAATTSTLPTHALRFPKIRCAKVFPSPFCIRGLHSVSTQTLPRHPILDGWSVTEYGWMNSLDSGDMMECENGSSSWGDDIVRCEGGWQLWSFGSIQKKGNLG